MASVESQATGASRLILFIRTAYWVALLIVGAMALATYLLLQHMMAAHQRDDALMAQVDTQKTLSQRIVFLSNAARQANPEAQKTLIASLRDSIRQFEENYDYVITATEIDGSSPSSETVRTILFRGPHHLDHFTSNLVANGLRLASALETNSGLSIPGGGYQGSAERALLDDTVAGAALAGYTALGEHLAANSQALLDRMLSVHRMLFYAMVGVLGFVALFIFRPMTEMIRRRTSQLVEARNSMAFIAAHDGLTGLNNRSFLRASFESLLARAARDGERLAVIQIDLDRFKQINDSLGHAAGDFVLVTTAQRMRTCCRPADVCVRLGGDEFVMVLPNAGDDAEIEAMVRRTLARIAEPMAYEGTLIECGVSAGIAIYPADADNGADLIVHADLALYAAKKKEEGGAFAFFSGELRQDMEHRKQLERDLAEAIAAQDFAVHFQPQVSLSRGDIVGIEALVRWPHARRGMVRPGAFIPVAEKAGFMPAIGRIVMRKAIFEAAKWHREGIEFGRLALNVSGAELREADFIDFLSGTLEEAGLPTARLSLEIVESVILDDDKTGITGKLAQMRAAGVHLELDDFGTGYASLSHVSPSEIDRLKIDRRFVQNIDRGGENAKIVRAIADLAQGLDIAIVAEGAETEAELSSLMALGCDQVQGYAVAFPMPPDEARAWLELQAAKAGAQPAKAAG